MSRIFITLLFISLVHISFAERTGNSSEISSEYPLVHSLWLSAGGDYVATSTGDEIREEIAPSEKIRVNSSLPINFKYSFSFTDPKVRHYLSGGYQGVAVGVLNFGSLQAHGFKKATTNIGYPVLVYVFQGGPFHKFNERLSLGYEWNFGASFGWKPYSEANKYFNLTVGSSINAYLSLGLNLNWHLNPSTDIFAGMSISHFSNGNTSFPNPGVNEFGMRVGVRWILNPIEKDSETMLDDSIRHEKVKYDISLWGASRRRVYRGGEKPVLLRGHFACAGISFSPLFVLNKWWRLGPSLDIQWDESSDMKKNYIEGTTTDDIKFTRPDFFRQITVGISAHGELRMPIFAVNIGCGYNFISPWENRGSYQNITLKTFIYDPLYINIGYQLRNFHQQSSLMLGLGLSI